MKIKNGLALIKIGSHQARQKLENRLGRLPNGYFDWHRQGFLEDNSNDLVSLAQILGHESLNTTAPYAKRRHEQLAEASERLTY